MPALHLHNLHALPPALPALPRPAHFDRRALVGYRECLVVGTHDVCDGESCAAVVLRCGEEGFDGVREEQGGGVGGGGGLDVVVKDGDWGRDGCCWALGGGVWG